MAKMTASNSPPNVGRRLAAARQERGLTQASVAASAGLAPSYLSRIENGRVQPTLPTLTRIVQVMGLDPVEVFGPRGSQAGSKGPCPVTPRGRCLLDLVSASADQEHYTPREVRLLRRFARWLKQVEPNRIRAMEILLDDLGSAAAGSGKE
jgi:transcriptional regulator with XRE-family HTH domain